MRITPFIMGDKYFQDRVISLGGISIHPKVGLNLERPKCWLTGLHRIMTLYIAEWNEARWEKPTIITCDPSGREAYENSKGPVQQHCVHTGLLLELQQMNIARTDSDAKKYIPVGTQR